MPRSKDKTDKTFECVYHIKGVEDGIKTVVAENIQLALALCEMWLYNYTAEYFTISGCHLIDTNEDDF